VSAISVVRVHDPDTPRPGRRFLVDRLWPRGVRKDALALDGWLRDVAPSDELRRWFGHDPARWTEFATRYQQELAARPEALTPLVEAARRGPITLVYGARDKQHNEAVVLKEALDAALGPEQKAG
jgi:uncharacterized protein YeaO (DUF488 family)